MVAASTHQNFAERIDFDFEYNLSALSTNLNSPISGLDNYSYYDNFRGLFDVRTTSSFNAALKSDIAYTHDRFSIAANYSLIDPDYQSLGTAFLNNDYQSLGFMGATVLFKKLNLQAAFVQNQNNISKSQVSTITATDYALNLSYPISSKLSATANYNLNVASSQMNDPELDSLNFFQNTSNLGGNLSYILPKGNLNHAFTAMAMYQSVNGNQGQPSDFYNGVLSYALALKEKGLSLSSSIMYNTFMLPVAKTTSFGPNISIRKKLIDGKVNLGASASYLSNRTNSVATSGTINTKLKADYKLKSHTIGADVGIIKKSNNSGANSFTETKGSIRYGFTF